jgi:hypothetical protein
MAISRYEQEQIEQANDSGWCEVADKALEFVKRFA